MSRLGLLGRIMVDRMTVVNKVSKGKLEQSFSLNA